MFHLKYCLLRRIANLNSDFRVYSPNTERSWHVPWGQDVFRPSLFTATVFRTIRFFCDFLYVIVLPFTVQSFYQEPASFYILLKKNIYNSLTVNEDFTRWFLLQGNVLVLAHRLLARISFKLRKIASNIIIAISYLCP